VSQIAINATAPDRVVGTHWWNPPDLIPIVEVVRGEHTSEHTMQRTLALLEHLGKLAVRVDRDVPPFTMVEGHPGRVRGLNRIGLRRSGMADRDDGAQLRQLQEVWALLYRSDLVLADALRAARQLSLLPAAIELCDFLEASVGAGRRGPLPAQR
jgi:hypothetical protein